MLVFVQSLYYKDNYNCNMWRLKIKADISFLLFLSEEKIFERIWIRYCGKKIILISSLTAEKHIEWKRTAFSYWNIYTLVYGNSPLPCEESSNVSIYLSIHFGVPFFGEVINRSQRNRFLCFSTFEYLKVQQVWGYTLVFSN